MPASEAGENDDDVTSVAGDDDDGEDVNENKIIDIIVTLLTQK